MVTATLVLSCALLLIRVLQARFRERALVDEVARVERASALARDTDARCKAIFEHSIDALLICSHAGKIIDANPEAARLFGLSNRDLVRRDFREFLSNAHGEFASLVSSIQAGHVSRASGSCLPKDATAFAIDVQGWPIRLTSGQALLLSLRSLTERQEQQRAMGEALRLAQQANQHIEFEFADDLPATIRTDPTRLRQILINLIGNAIKFTSAGEVRVATRLVRDPERPPQLEVAVTDTGIGIDPRTHADPLRAVLTGGLVDYARVRGPGLGLALSRRLAEILGGSIRVESTCSESSRLTLRIATGPIAQHPPVVADLSAYSDALCGAGEAAPAGAEIEVAKNGQIAVDRLLGPEPDSQFDLVLMELQMPELDGYAATGVLRDAGFEAPIVALTAHAMSGEERRCLAAGCSAFLTKPVRRQQLVEMILSQLENQEQTESD